MVRGVKVKEKKSTKKNSIRLTNLISKYLEFYNRSFLGLPFWIEHYL